jgi:hypothetical protein
METIEQRVALKTDQCACSGCGERIAQCACDEPWEGPFRFGQLGDHAQEKAIDQQAIWNTQDWAPLLDNERPLEVVKHLGFELETRAVPLHGGGGRHEPDIAYSIGDRGEYVTFSGTWRAENFSLNALQEHVGAGNGPVLALGLRMMALFMRYPTAEAKITVSHSRNGTMHAEFYPQGSAAWTLDDAMGGHGEDETMTELARDTAHWLLRQWTDEYNSLGDRDRCSEDIAANEYTFNADGGMA